MSRQTNPLTNTAVEKAKPKDKPYRLYDGAGLVLNIAKSGTKTWYYQYKHPVTRKADMYKIGRYPAISLADARKARAECAELIEQEHDPKSYYKNQMVVEQRRLSNDFKSVFDEWLPTKKYSEKTLNKTQGYFDYALSVIGNKPVDEITTADCMAVLNPIKDDGCYTKLQKIRTMIGQVMTYAIATGRASHNPALHLRGVFETGEVNHNPAILDEARLADLVQSIKSYSGHFVTRQALIFALLTFARPGEVRHIKWSDVDMDKKTWEYTPSKTRKSTKVKMVTPLSSQAVQILTEMRDYNANGLIFASSQNKHKPLSENTLNQALRRMGFDGSEQTSQGFRAIARTLLEEKFKYDYRMIEMQIGHKVVDSNGRAYNRVKWLGERREMVQEWADYIYSLFM